ncbi:MAG: hypothetical protein ABIE42_07905 [Candidatus Eisenbacteria bacterium]
MKRTAQAGALLVVSLLLLNTGCYTVLQHPTGSSVAHEGSAYRSCADCHADAAYYHPYSHPYYSYGRSHNRWGSYYGSPWWHNDHWQWDQYDYDHDYDHDYDAPEVETGTRHLWSPGGWASSGWGFAKPGSGTSRATPPANLSSKKDDKKDDKKDEEKDEEKEKDERNLWKKPKKGF